MDICQANARGTNARDANARGTNAKGTNIKMLIWRQTTGTFPRKKMAKGAYARKAFARMSNIKRFIRRENCERDACIEI